ncbi:transglutaminase domain-containing protein [Caloramator sp. mosi_1]|uniref:transglutaminase domain-containing protein n=1 Tax=Caloramator sp. mosi_1 TaxID=3023090 RepID=UPI0023618785|nr:transglutaminase domain-containing protein [Caloramator sp. mosi_1]WDC84409.1 transglutaminase domain-containing protein [Caloramator sp. mosi_1]
MKKLFKLQTLLLILILLFTLTSDITLAKGYSKNINNYKVYAVKIGYVDLLTNRYTTVLNVQMKKKAPVIVLSSNGYNEKIADTALTKAVNAAKGVNNVEKLSIKKHYRVNKKKRVFIGYSLNVQYKKTDTSPVLTKDNGQATVSLESYSQSIDFFLLEKDKENVNKLNYEIAKAIFEGKNSIFIDKSLYSGDIKTLSNAIEDVLYSYSDFAYLRQIKYSSDSKGTTIYFGYVLPQQEILKMNLGLYEVVKNAASKIENKVNEAKTTEEKIKVIHDYVAYNFSYDVDFLKTGDEVQYARDSHAYYALTTNKTICGGYSSAFQRLTKYFGIESIIVIGIADGEGHAWNKVKVGDSWLHVDVTFDDPVINGYPNKNMVRYDYFLKTDEEMSKTHKWN